MNIYGKKNYVVLEGVRDFNIEEILECGQCFNFIRCEDYKPDETKKISVSYDVMAYGRAIHIIQDDDIVTIYGTDEDEYRLIWNRYFDMDTDYSAIKTAILKSDSRLEESINAKPGIRILNQDFFETLISFIISQNKQIPQIKQVVRNISEKCGAKTVTYKGEEIHAFPTLEELMTLSEEDLRACKTGFRAPYIMDACRKVADGEVSEEELRKLPVDEARKMLMKIKGVGEKVANCVLLFSLGRREAFPVDVWMKRIMENMYFGQDTNKAEIEKFACEKFGEYAGYAQQYLFFYGRENKVGDARVNIKNSLK